MSTSRPLALTTYLEMHAPAQLRPARAPDEPFALTREQPPSGEVSRALYEAVGADWSWVDRADWSAERWQDWADVVQTWVATVDGERAGYAELLPDGAGEVEVAFFGLQPGFGGRGLGGHLLTEVVRRAWAVPGTRRVWLHTCTLDSEAALPNYRARGFAVYDERME